MDAHSRWAELVAETVAEGIEGMSRGIPPADTMATRLGQALHADAASHGWLDNRTGRYELSGWPASLEGALLARATFAVAHTHPQLVHWLQGNLGVATVSWAISDATVRGPEPSLVPRPRRGEGQADRPCPNGHPHRVRILGFARYGDFTREELGLLGFLRRPMMALIDHGDLLALRGVDGSSPGGEPAVLQRAASLDLTSRELEVLALLADGLLAVTIAARLAISTRTVHRHLAHIYAKLDTHDRLSTVMRAQELRLLAGAIR